MAEERKQEHRVILRGDRLLRVSRYEGDENWTVDEVLLDGELDQATSDKLLKVLGKELR